MSKYKVLISLGSNMGDRELILGTVIGFCQTYNIIKDIKYSKVYETEPYGEKDQPDFLNMCFSGYTEFSALTLIDILKNMEKDLGRIKRDKWKEREIDIDILFYEDIELNHEKLELPHPRMHERKFVLIPANEIESEMIHPVFNKTVKQLLDECKDESEVKIFESNFLR